MPNALPIIDEPQHLRSCDLPANYQPTNVEREQTKLLPNILQLASDGIWSTYQGEGKTIGAPCIFMRLLSCNLQCAFCDAPHAIRKDRREYYDGSSKTIAHVAREIQRQWRSRSNDTGFQGTPRLVITGGEPLLQQENIIRLLALLPAWDVEIETNGTVLPAQAILDRCQINCSPKLHNSQMSEGSRIKPDVIQAICLARAAYFKVVCASQEDINEWQRVYEKPLAIDPSKVILMPEGITREEIDALIPMLTQEAKRYGYAVTTRLQCKSKPV